jgi:RNA polymerase sigma-70 factor, ECF subfamily
VGLLDAAAGAVRGVGVEDEAAADATLQSFVAFYDEQYRPLLAFSASLCSDIHAAEDLTQDAFLAAERRWDALSRFDRPDLWVRRVVANRARSRWRRLASEERRARRLSDAARSAHVTGISVAETDIWSLVRLLPPRQAQVVALTYLDDRSIADVAAILDIGVETVKTHLRRGKAALARALEIDADSEDRA